MRCRGRGILAAAGVAAALVLLGYYYLHPASRLAVTGQVSPMIGDLDDSTSLPFTYYALVRTWKTDPWLCFYGTVFTPLTPPPSGGGMIVPWGERLVVLAGALFAPWETLPTFVMWAFMVLNGLAFYFLGRREGWGLPICLGLSIAFAFNPYASARALRHPSLIGIFYLATVFLGLRILQRSRTWKGLAAAAALLLASAFAAHYYIVITAALSPLLLWFYLRDFSPRSPYAEHPAAAGGRAHWAMYPLLRLGLAALPAILFLLWNVLALLPARLQRLQAVDPLPQSSAANYQRLVSYWVHPIDYLSGEIASGERDLNPLRTDINSYVRSHLDRSNLVERANGIRWTLLALLGLAVYLLIRPSLRRRVDPRLLWNIRFFLVLAAVGVWFGLGPRYPRIGGHDLGLARWLAAIVPELRTPSRFGPVVHFAVLMIAGHLLQYLVQSGRSLLARQGAPPAAAGRPDRAARKLRKRERGRVATKTATDRSVAAPVSAGSRPPSSPWPRCAFALGFPLLMILDFFPLDPIRTQPTGPARTELMPKDGRACGGGIYFPYLSPRFTRVLSYQAGQELRDTDCMLNHETSFELTAADLALFRRLGTPPLDQAMRSRLKRFLACTHSDWIVLRDVVPEDERRLICEELGWQRVSASACRRPEPAPSPVVAAAECVGTLDD